LSRRKSLVQGWKFEIGCAHGINFEIRIRTSAHQTIELLLLSRERIFQLKQCIFRLSKLRLHIERIRLQRHPLDQVAARVLVELPQEFDGCQNTFLALSFCRIP
jgi:hypothetical protein